jgi:hypothetical protein
MTISNIPNYYTTSQLLHGANYLTTQHKCIGCLGKITKCSSCLRKNPKENENTNLNISKNDKAGYYTVIGAKVSIVAMMGFAVYKLMQPHSV